MVWYPRALCALIDLFLFWKLIWAWRHQDDWHLQCRSIDEWHQYFKDQVAHGWIFGDGLGQ